MRIQKQDYFIDPNPTRVDYPIIKEEYASSYGGERCARPYTRATSAPAPAPAPQVTSPAPAPSGLPSVTEVEVAALRGVDIAEQVAEPLNRFTAARAGIKLAAWVARKLR